MNPLSKKQNFIKYTILLLVFLNFPGFVLVKVNPILSSILSIGTYALLVLFYIDVKKRHQPNMWLIFLVVGYFSISALVNPDFTPTLRFFVSDFIKILIILICGEEIIRRLEEKELYIILMMGALSIVLHIYLFFDPLIDSGRFSGFYLDPNAAGFICICGYSLSFAFKGKLRFIGQIVFVLMGLLTLSRTFIILLILTNLISIKLDFKNARLFGYGFLLILLMVSFNEFLPIKNVRLKQLSDFVSGKEVNVKEVGHDSRDQTWAIYYDYIIEKPFFGNGYDSFSGGLALQKVSFAVGVHNTYLKILGEAGIFVFIIFVLFIIKINKSSWKIFKEKPYLFFLAVNLSIFLLTVHNYFDTHHRLFLSMWIYTKIFQTVNKDSLTIQTKQLDIK